MVQRGKALQWLGWLGWWVWGCCLPLLMVAVGSAHGGNVSYDGRSLIIDGQNRILFSGSIHYPRSTPEMWSSIIATAKEGGLDVIQTYVFWNLHEVRPGEYRFDGKRNLVRFIKAVQAQGLYVCLRIGPFIESEWTYGGLPFWLHDIPDIIFRTDNEQFKFYMERFTTKIVEMMKSESLFASQGGPIILSQIENEYSLIQGVFREQGLAYIHWAAQMAVGLQTGVPWIMCRQDDAPDPVINTCNNLHCGDLWPGPNSPNKPSMWTENWTSFYQVYGEEPTIRQAEDIAFSVAFFIAKNGSYVNYYMYHGGTNFGRSASAFVTTSYYDQAPIDEYGLIRQPTWGHLKELHAAIKLSLEPLLPSTQKIISLGEQQEAYVFSGNSGKCAAFLVNRNPSLASVVFQNVSYELPGKSISILPDCETVAFNTAMVHAPQSIRSMTPIVNFDSTEKWSIYKEPISNFDDTSIRADTLLEHTNTTKDISDYLWYTFRYQLDSPNTQSVLRVQSHGHVLHVFVNGALAGSLHGSYRIPNFTFENSVTLVNGANNISLLSATVGLPDAGAYLEHKVLGLQRVMLQDQDFRNYSWGYQVGLSGEHLKVYSIVGSTMVRWEQFNNSTQSLTWYKTLFDAPAGDDPIALNLNSMGKGQVWVNGQSIGRYWVSFHTSNATSSQTWYNVPRSFLNSTENLLVILEEESGNPLGISLDVVSSRKFQNTNNPIGAKRLETRKIQE